MTLSQAIIKRINTLINENNQIENYHQLSLKAGLNESVIRAILSGETKNPTVSTIFFISNAFDISLADFYDDPLFDIENIDDN